MFLLRNSIHRTSLLAIAAAGLVCVPMARAAAPAASSDPILKAMQMELDREKAQLLLPGMQKPYFIEYRIDDFATYEVLANYGALVSEASGHQRIVRVTVRVGDYTTDSSTNRGEGTAQFASSDDNPEAIRYALWTATDDAYKNALRGYTAKLAALKRFEGTPQAKDFAQEIPVTHIGPLVSLDINRDDWRKRIVDASGLYATDPEVRANAANVQYASANMRGIAVNRYLVNTEGTVTRQGYTAYADTVSVGTQAPDGMQLSRDNGSNATTAAGLESWNDLHRRVIDNLKNLEALRNAPLVSADDYHGPVLFSGDAATDTFAALFAPNIQATRPQTGTTARTQGQYTSSYHSRVLPDFLSVIDNPLTKTLNGKTLLGAYEVDDEGVPARPVNLVVNGALENYVIGRTPIRDFPESNGHGRAVVGQAAQPRTGVLMVKAAQPMTRDALFAKLVSMAKDQGHDVYYVETLGGPLVPRVLYQVHADGTRKLVRGAVFDELDTRSLRADILAAGDDDFVANSIAPLPLTIVAPSLLFDDIGVKRSNTAQQKLPYYPPPQ